MARGVEGTSLANVAQCLSGLPFPCQKDQVIAHAEHHGADQALLAVLRHLPEDTYSSMADVMKGYGKAYASVVQSGHGFWSGFRAQYAQRGHPSHNG